MTRDEILALEGRELDFAVDRHVFGGVNLAEPRYQDMDKGSGHYERGVDMWRLYVPRYSADIAAAWQVVERMRETYFPEIRFGHGIDDRPDVWVIFHTSDHHCWYPCKQNGVSAPPDQVPTAICRAALLAVCGEGEA